MTFRDTLGLAFRNLGQAKLRTLLTTLGVAIGIASLSGMVSLGVGLQDQLVGQFTQSGMFDSITVMESFGSFGSGGFRGRGRRGRAMRGGALAEAAPETTETKERLRLDDEAIRTLSAMEHVKTVHPSLRVFVQVKLDTFEDFESVSGTPMSAKGEGVFQSIPYGAFFANETDPACMVSLDVAEEMTKAPADLIGKTLTLSYIVSSKKGATAGVVVNRAETACPIVGIVERAPATDFGGFGSAGVMMPLPKVREIYRVQVTSTESLFSQQPEERDYPTLTVKVTAPQHTQDVQKRIEELGYSAFSLNDTLQGAKRAFIIIDLILALIGSIALSVSSLGIMNTMVMSILERTREIGVMKAIGGSDGNIRRIFLIEASAIGVFGGVLGVALGWIVGRVINFGANVYIENQGGTAGNLFSLPLWLVASAIGFSILVSLIAGMYPARRAARLDPIQALRHD